MSVRVTLRRAACCSRIKFKFRLHNDLVAGFVSGQKYGLIRLNPRNHCFRLLARRYIEEATFQDDSLLKYIRQWFDSGTFLRRYRQQVLLGQCYHRESVKMRTHPKRRCCIYQTDIRLKKSVRDQKNLDLKS